MRGELLKALIENILRPLATHAAIRPAALLLLASGLLSFAASHGSIAREIGFASPPASEDSAKADPEFQAKKAEIFKKFHIREAKPGEYPITVLPSDKVLPVMHGVTDVGDIAWLDNDTIIYVPQTGQTWEEINDHPGSLWLNSLNLKTLEAKRIARASADHFCYDYETHNIRFVGVAGDAGNEEKAIVYGKLDGHLDTFVPPARIKGKAAFYAHQPTSFTNHLDCTFYPQVSAPGTLGRTAIRTVDGYVALENENGRDIPGSYVFRKPDGTIKHLTLGSSNLSWFQYEYFSRLYWHYEDTHWENGQPDGIKVWHLNRDFDIVSEEFIPHGPWAHGYPLRYSMRAGFLIGSSMWGGAKFTRDTKIHGVTYLVTSNTITEVAEDVFGGELSVSPDGCKAVGMKYDPPERGNQKPTGELAILNVCKKQ